MSSGRIVHLAIITLSLLVFSCVNLAAENACPGPNKVPHKDGTYDFTYESWVKKYQSGDYWNFGRCVENKLTTLEMYVDWENTGVSGWAKPKDTVYAVVESPSSLYKLLPTDLWYGSGPRKINAPYRETKVGRAVVPGAVKSLVHMAVPENSMRVAETLVSIEVEFTSEVMPEPKGFKYSYSWSDALAKDRAPVRFRWRGLALLLSATATRPPEQLRLLAHKSEVSFVSMAPPTYGVTLVEFLAQEGEKVVGTAPIATYHPSNVNLPPMPGHDGEN